MAGELMKKVAHIRFEVVCLKPDFLINKPFPSVGKVFGYLENRGESRFALQLRGLSVPHKGQSFFINGGFLSGQ